MDAQEAPEVETLLQALLVPQRIQVADKTYGHVDARLYLVRPLVELRLVRATEREDATAALRLQINTIVRRVCPELEANLLEVEDAARWLLGPVVGLALIVSQHPMFKHKVACLPNDGNLRTHLLHDALVRFVGRQAVIVERRVMLQAHRYLDIERLVAILQQGILALQLLFFIICAAHF